LGLSLFCFALTFSLRAFAATPTDQNLNGIGNGPATPAAPAAGGWGAYWDYVKSYVATTQQPAKLELPPVEEYYDVITFKQLVGVLVAVFVAKKHSKFVSEIQSQIVTTGILGVMVRLTLTLGSSVELPLISSFLLSALLVFF
jgi:hypothetical protein